MKRFFRLTSYTTFLRYVFLLLLFLSINCLESDVMPYSTSVLAALISIKTKPIMVCLIYLSSFVVLNKLGLLAQAIFCCGVFISIYYIYKKFNTKTKIEYIFYLAFSQIIFIFLGDTLLLISFEKRIITSLITILLGAFFIIGINAIENKGLKYKFSNEEIISTIILFVSFGLGFSHLFSPLIYKCISFVLILAFCFILDGSIGSILSTILALPLAVYFGDLNYISLYFVLGLIVVCFMPISKYASCLSLIVCEFVMQYFFSIYSVFQLNDIIFSALSAFVFLLIPNFVLNNTKNKLSFFKEKHLVRQSINRNRLFLSNKLYEISGVFSEMSNAFGSFSDNQITETKAKESITSLINKEICSKCLNNDKCSITSSSFKDDLSTLLNIGFAKGKLTLIDLPKELFNCCIHPNDLIFAVNKFLAEYKIIALDNQNLENGRKLLRNEADGIAEILKSLAVDAGSILKFHNKLEKEICDLLLKNGFYTSEILIFGEEQNLKITLILSMKEFSLNHLTFLLNSLLPYPVILSEKVNIDENKIYLAFIKSSKYDAAFGIAKENKDGSSISGDTYSISKISNDKFIVALSDGMGSGEKAQNISSISLSLIESFYKAGMRSENILLTVNKLLALYTEDTFTALDIGVINLENGKVDFIKYGSPYGFIINNNGVRIIESNSLPLGILNEIKPSICTTTINDGDIILLVSDGISDAFGSSSELIEFLRKIPALNPQTLADRIMKKAIEFTAGQKKDDMTAVAVRIFNKY